MASIQVIDYLRDFVQHTHGLGIIDLIRVEGTAKETAVSAIDNNRQVVVQAKTLSPVTEFVGVFGMPSLSNLNTILGISEYKDNAKVTMAKRPDGELSGIAFENASGDFKNDYRFMSKELVNDKLKSVKFKGATWLVDIVPGATAIQKFGYQALANSDETMFAFEVVNNNLIFTFGDHSSHAGNFVFASGIKATFKHAWDWPISIFKSIMALPGDKKLKLSDEGVIMITVNSGLVDYNYMIPALIK